MEGCSNFEVPILKFYSLYSEEEKLIGKRQNCELKSISSQTKKRQQMLEGFFGKKSKLMNILIQC